MLGLPVSGSTSARPSWPRAAKSWPPNSAMWLRGPRRSPSAKQELARRCRELSEHDERLLKQDREVERRLARLAAAESAQQQGASPADAAKAEELKLAAEALEARQEQLDEAERRLAKSQAEIQKLCDRLAADRADVVAWSAILREQAAAEHRQAMADIEDRRQSVQRRAEHVDKLSGGARASPRRIGDACTARRWKSAWRPRNSGRSFPAPRRRPQLTQSLGRIRTKLAEQYARPMPRWPSRERNWKRSATSLSPSTRSWSNRSGSSSVGPPASHEECQQQAARLAAREQQLHDEELELRQAAAAMAGRAAQVSTRAAPAAIADWRRRTIARPGRLTLRVSPAITCRCSWPAK